MRVPGLALVLLTSCTSGTPRARPATTSTPTTQRPSATPYRSADLACRVGRTAGSGGGGDQTFVFLDVRVGVLTQGGWLFRTTDGGTTWRPAYDFPRLREVVPAGCETRDAGATWREIALP